MAFFCGILLFMNIPLTHAAEGLERRRFTVDDCFRMVEAGIIGWDERFELIGGEIVPMSPKGIRHERLKQWLNKHLVKNLPDKMDVIQETTFRLSEDTFIEPDFVIYPAGKLEELSPETCLLAIEIADSSLKYDIGRKAQLYAQFGIKELWVMDVTTLSTRIHLAPDDKSYTSVSDIEHGGELVPVKISELSLNLKKYS